MRRYLEEDVVAKIAVLIEVSFTYSKHTDLKSRFLFQDGQMRQSERVRKV